MRTIEYYLELDDGTGELAFEWDNQKAASNLNKHGISFEEAVTIFQEDTLTNEDATAYGELREVSYGRVQSDGLASTVVVCVVHTDRGEKVRIISARKATAKERKHFDVYYRKTTH